MKFHAVEPCVIGSYSANRSARPGRVAGTMRSFSDYFAVSVVFENSAAHICLVITFVSHYDESSPVS
jgi:hypothetical protein